MYILRSSRFAFEIHATGERHICPRASRAKPWSLMSMWSYGSTHFNLVNRYRWAVSCTNQCPVPLPHGVARSQELTLAAIQPAGTDYTELHGAIGPHYVLFDNSRHPYKLYPTPVRPSLHDKGVSQLIIRVGTSGTMCWARHVARTEQTKKVYTV
jgi:hypothetical protein